MAGMENLPDTFTTAGHHAMLLSTATRVDELVWVMSSYLASWSRDRIERLHKIDGGWGPFEYFGRPRPIREVDGIKRVANAISRQCAALKEAGIDLNPEIRELEHFFGLATKAADTLR